MSARGQALKDENCLFLSFVDYFKVFLVYFIDYDLFLPYTIRIQLSF